MKDLVKKLKKIDKKTAIIIGIIVLVVLAAIILITSGEDKEKGITEGKYPQEEISLDLGNTKCSKGKSKKIVSDAKKISLEYAKEKIKVGFDETTGEDILENVFNVTITNVTKDFYVMVRNDYTNDVVKLTNDDAKDNNVVFQTMYSNDIIKYTIEVYTTDSGCKDELYRKFTFTTPIFNIYSDSSYCIGNEDFEYCKEEIFTAQISFDEFTTKLEEYKKKK